MSELERLFSSGFGNGSPEEAARKFLGVGLTAPTREPASSFDQLARAMIGEAPSPPTVRLSIPANPANPANLEEPRRLPRSGLGRVFGPRSSSRQFQPDLNGLPAEFAAGPAQPVVPKPEPIIPKPAPGGLMARIGASAAELEARSAQSWELAVNDEGRLFQLNKRRAAYGLPPVSEIPKPQTAGDVAAEATTGRGMVAMIPFVGAASEAVDLWDVYAAAKRAEKGQGSESDWELLADHQDQLVRLARGKTIGGGAASIVVGGIPYALEFLASGGIGSLIRAGVSKGAKRLLSETVKEAAIREATEKAAEAAGKSITGRALSGVGRLATESAARLPAFAPRIVGQTIANLTPRYTVKPEDGAGAALAVSEPGQQLFAALRDALADQYIEVVSEAAGGTAAGELLGRLGGAAARGAGRAGQAVARVAAPRLSEFVARTKLGIAANLAERFPNRFANLQQAAEYLGRAGFHGPIAEIGEERLGDVLRWAAHGAARGAGLTSRIEPGAMPSAEQLLTEFLGFSALGAGGRAAVAALSPEEPRETREAATPSLQAEFIDYLREGPPAETRAELQSRFVDFLSSTEASTAPAGDLQSDFLRYLEPGSTKTPAAEAEPEIDRGYPIPKPLVYAVSYMAAGTPRTTAFKTIEDARRFLATNPHLELLEPGIVERQRAIGEPLFVGYRKEPDLRPETGGAPSAGVLPVGGRTQPETSLRPAVSGSVGGPAPGGVTAATPGGVTAATPGGVTAATPGGVTAAPPAGSRGPALGQNEVALGQNRPIIALSGSPATSFAAELAAAQERAARARAEDATIRANEPTRLIQGQYASERAVPPRAGAYALEVPAQGATPAFTIRKMKNRTHLVRFEAAPSPETQKRLMGLGGRLIPKLDGWIVKRGPAIDQIEAAVLGKPIPRRPNVPETPTATGSELPPIDQPGGGLKPIDATRAVALLSLPEKDTRGLVTETLGARGYRYVTPAGEKFEYMLHPDGQYRYLMTRSGTVLEQRRPDGRWGSQPTARHVTFKDFARSIRSKLWPIVERANLAHLVAVPKKSALAGGAAAVAPAEVSAEWKAGTFPRSVGELAQVPIANLGLEELRKLVEPSEFRASEPGRKIVRRIKELERAEGKRRQEEARAENKRRQEEARAEAKAKREAREQGKREERTRRKAQEAVEQAKRRAAEHQAAEKQADKEHDAARKALEEYAKRKGYRRKKGANWKKKTVKEREDYFRSIDPWYVELIEAERTAWSKLRGLQSRRHRELSGELRERGAAAAEAGRVTMEALEYGFMHHFPEPVRLRMADEARRLLAQTESEAVRAALQKIIDDAGHDVGADVERQRGRIAGILAAKIDQRTRFEREVLGTPRRDPDGVIFLFLEPDAAKRRELVAGALRSIRRDVAGQVRPAWDVEHVLHTAARQELERHPDHPFGATAADLRALLKTWLAAANRAHSDSPTETPSSREPEPATSRGTADRGTSPGAAASSEPVREKPEPELAPELAPKLAPKLAPIAPKPGPIGANVEANIELSGLAGLDPNSPADYRLLAEAIDAAETARTAAEVLDLAEPDFVVLADRRDKARARLAARLAKPVEQVMATAETFAAAQAVRFAWAKKQVQALAGTPAAPRTAGETPAPALKTVGETPAPALKTVGETPAAERLVFDSASGFLGPAVKPPLGTPWNPPADGAPVRVTAYRGSGRTEKGAVYDPRAAGPIMGAGRYYAFDAEQAKEFGPNVVEETLTLENPVFIRSHADLKKIGVEYIPLTIEEMNSLTALIQAWVEGGGHDAVVVEVPASGDSSRGGENAKRLGDIFGISQVFIPEGAEPGLPAESGEREPWQMTRGEFEYSSNYPRFEAIQEALERGKPIVLTTHLKAVKLTAPEHIRIRPDGRVQIPEGRNWVTLTDDQVIALAAQAGVKPIEFGERKYHRAEVERAAAAGLPVPAHVLAEYGLEAGAPPAAVDEYEMTPQEREYLRNAGDKPAFGIGAMANTPELRKWWAQQVDRIIGAITKTTPGSILDNLKHTAGHWISGADFFLSDAQKREFRALRGQANWATEETAKVVELIRKQEAELTRQRKQRRGFISVKRQRAIARRYHRRLERILEGGIPYDSLPAAERRIFDLYAEPVRRMSDWILANEWTWPHLRAFGFESIDEAIRIRRQGPGVYLRRLYRPGGLLGPQKNAEDEPTRMVRLGPYVRGGQYLPRLGDAERWVVVDRTERPIKWWAFDSPEKAKEAAKAMREQKRERWGSRIEGLIYAISPFSVDELASKGWFVVDTTGERTKLDQFETKSQAVAEAAVRREQRLAAGVDPGRVRTGIRVEQRAPLIPERNISVRIARTIQDTASNIASLRLQEWLRQTVALPENPNEDSDPRFMLYEQVPSNPAWGPIRGMWLPRHVFARVMEYEHLSNAWWVNYWRWAVYMFNTSKVVWNVGSTWALNIVSDSVGLLLDGSSNWHRPAMWIEAAKEMRSRGPYYEALVKSGKLRAGYAEHDLRDLIQRIEHDPSQPTLALMKFFHHHPKLQQAALRTGEAIKAVNKTLAAGYDLFANLAKLGSYMTKRKMGLTHEEAVDLLVWYPTYEERGKLAKWSQRSGIGQAIGASYLDQVGKILGRAVRERPVRLLVLAGLPGMLNMVGRMLAGIDDDEERRIVSDDPRFNSWVDRYFTVALPFRGDDGQAQFINLKRFFPMVDDLDLSNPSGGLRIPFVFQHPWVSLGFELAANREARTGRPIMPAEAKDWGTARRAFHWANYTLARLAPLPSRILRPGSRPGGAVRLAAAALGQSDESVWRVLLSEGLGINIVEPRPRRDQLQRILDRYNKADRMNNVLDAENSFSWIFQGK